jgi:phage baseplate assembly protein W
MLDRRDIPHLHWQPMLGRNVVAPASTLGQIVHGLADVEQAINTIVLTEKGSVPTQPEKCTRLMPYIDRRPEYAIPNITREIWDAITAWEPRVIVERVAITREDLCHFRFPVFWRLRADVTRSVRQTVVTLPGERIQAITQ